MQKISDEQQRIVQKRMAAQKYRLTILCLASVLAIGGGTLLGQSAVQINGVDVTTAAGEAGDAAAP